MRRTKAATSLTRESLLAGSARAKRQAAVVLEVLSGERTPMEASRLMGVALPRYYLLETRALGGLIAALEPRPKGKQPTTASRMAAMDSDNRRLSRELARTQALLRAAQRSIGLPAPAARTKTAARGKDRAGRRRRRPSVRARKVVALLRREEGEEQTAPTPTETSAKEG